MKGGHMAIVGSGGVVGSVGDDQTRPTTPSQSNLLRRFVDEGDMLLGRFLQRSIGQRIYSDALKRVNDSVSLSEVYDICLAAILFDKILGLSRDDARIVAYAVVEKAVKEYLRSKLV